MNNPVAGQGVVSTPKSNYRVARPWWRGIHLWRLKVTEVAELLALYVPHAGRWINLFIQPGEAGLMISTPGRSKDYSEKVIQKVLLVLVESF